MICFRVRTSLVVSLDSFHSRERDVGCPLPNLEKRRVFLDHLSEHVARALFLLVGFGSQTESSRSGTREVVGFGSVVSTRTGVDFELAPRKKGTSSSRRNQSGNQSIGVSKVGHELRPLRS